MGVVYKAEDTKLDRIVALKFLPLHLLTDKESEQRFISEAKAASSFDHPNICTIHDIEKTDDDQLFIVMAYYQGETLKKKIEKAPIKIDEAIDIVTQIAEGLKRAHDKGIVHRDIKPANIFITNEGIAKILDFGLAKVGKQQKLTTMGTTMGTVAYMSPEQTKGEEVDNRTDIWSLGIVLYEMLTGRPPFRGDYEQATMYSIMNDQPEPITGLRTGVPMKLEYLVEKTLSKNQDERYQHVDDILADLRRERKNIESAKVDSDNMRSSTSYVKTGQPRKNYRRYYISGLIIIILAVIATYMMFFRQESEINSIAVLPISIISSESSADILSDGIAEGIINSLSLIPSLKVMSWNSIFQYAGENVDVQEVGKRLDVKSVLLSRITQRGDSYSISVELVDADNKQHLWGAQYTRQASDIYSLQGEVSKDISDQLRVKLTGEEEKRVTKNYTENSEAYTLYIRGRFYMRKRTEEGLRKSIDFFNQAIEKDPNYTLAYVGISDGYSLLANNSYIPAEDGYPKAKQAIRKALDLDNELAEAHASLAAILGDYELNNTESIREYKRAIELNPNYAAAHHWYSGQLMKYGVFDEAIREAKRAQQLDPLSLRINQNVGAVYFFSRQYDKAIEWALKVIEMDSTHPGAHVIMGGAYFMKKQYDKALQAFEVETLLPGRKTQVYLSACVYGVTGQRAKALKVLEELKQLSTKTYVPTFCFAFIQLYLGNKGQAIKLLERAIDEKDPVIRYLKVEPWLDPLRSDPKFTELIRKAKFIQ